MASNSTTSRRFVLWFLIPALLMVSALRAAVDHAIASPQRTQAAADYPDSCRFPDPQGSRGRVFLIIVDSLRDTTALDGETMPFLASLTSRGLSGRMRPCLSQLSLLCMRTLLEGKEPLFAAGLLNFSGKAVDSPSLPAALRAKGATIAMVADAPLVETYRPYLDDARRFADRTEGSRDDYAMKALLEWQEGKDVDVVFGLIVDTDAVAHRHPVGTPPYRKKFGEVDAFLRTFVGRMGKQDSLVILGDHGHDLEGHHSTGVLADTAYFALGPAFAPGTTADVPMATAYHLLGVPSCIGPPAVYEGSVLHEVLRVDEREKVFLAAIPTTAPQTSGGPEGLLTWWPLMVLLGWLMLRLGWAVGAVRHRAGDAVVTVGLGIAAIGPPALGLQVTAVVALIDLVWSRRLLSPLATIGLRFLPLQIASGTFAKHLLVLLQDHVNVPWMLGFWAALNSAIAAVSMLLRRMLGVGLGRAMGLTAWLLVFFGLFLGPYYYGTARNLPFALSWFALAAGWSALKSPGPVRRWMLLGLVPLLPLHFPLLKEWKVSYPMLQPLETWGWALTIPVGLLLIAGAVAVLPERKDLRRPLSCLAAFLVLGPLTAMSPPTVIAGLLIMLSYWGLLRSAEALDDPWLAPIAAVSLVFMLEFVVYGGFRFANFRYEWTLDLVDPAWGEWAVMWAVLPLLTVRYLGPLVCMLLLRPLVARHALSLLVYKLLAMLVFLLGVQAIGSRSTLLFEVLQAEEIVILSFAYLGCALVWMRMKAP